MTLEVLTPGVYTFEGVRIKVSGTAQVRTLTISTCTHRSLFSFLLHVLSRISLNTMTLTVESPKVYTNQGVAVFVTGVAQVSLDRRMYSFLFVHFTFGECSPTP